MKQPAEGVIIASKYRLERPLASGGMGSVWVARHLQLDVPIAIKFMGIELASTVEGRVRFEREAKAAAFLQSPYVVSVQDYGVDEDLPYIVMELLKGEDLEDRLRRRKRLSLQEALIILTQASKALGRAHELGIVHRDLKPRNLFIASAHDEEIVKILDFGIAKQIDALNPSGATTQQVIGSPHYMSPEQIRAAKDIDHRSDLWSLGVILFRVITGRRPFRGDVLIDVLNEVITGPLPLATEVAHDLPDGIDDFFLRALTRDKSLRFQSAREMTAAFTDVVRNSILADRSSAGAPDLSHATSAVTPLHARSIATEVSRNTAPLSETAHVPSPPTLSDIETAQRPAILDPPQLSRPQGLSPKSAFAVAAILACALAVGVIVALSRRTPAPATQAEPLAAPPVLSGSSPGDLAEGPPMPVLPRPPIVSPSEVTVSPSAGTSSASPASSRSAASPTKPTTAKGSSPLDSAGAAGTSKSLPGKLPPAGSNKDSEDWGIDD